MGSVALNGNIISIDGIDGIGNETNRVCVRVQWQWQWQGASASVHHEISCDLKYLSLPRRSEVGTKYSVDVYGYGSEH